MGVSGVSWVESWGQPEGVDGVSRFGVVFFFFRNAFRAVLVLKMKIHGSADIYGCLVGRLGRDEGAAFEPRVLCGVVVTLLHFEG